MDAQGLPPPHLQAVIDRFVAACRADERVTAAFLTGSYAKGAADANSDLDLILVTADEAYNVFTTGRHAFAHQLGDPLFLEDFDLLDVLFLILPDGAEVELSFIPERRVGQLLDEPHWSLLDKHGLLAQASRYEVAPSEPQTETLRRQIIWFWHDLSHFITAISRGQLWWAYGQLETLRRICLNLARLRHNLADSEVGEDPSFKIDKALPAGELAALRETFCPQEPAAMLAAAQVLVDFYRTLAVPLAAANGHVYPAELERVILARLEQPGATSASGEET